MAGYRRGATTAIRCIDVAALVAATVLRKNPKAEVIPFESDVVKVRLNPRDSVMTNAEKLARLPCGGTNCSAPLRFLNRRRITQLTCVIPGQTEEPRALLHLHSHGNLLLSRFPRSQNKVKANLPT
jgi:hypothetical protein